MKLSTWLSLNLNFYNQIDRLKDWYVWKFQNPYNVSMPYGYAPVQIEGHLRTGEYYYFRSRHAHWSLQIFVAETEYFEPNASRELLFNYKENFGEEHDASWISKREAIKFANKAIYKYYDTQCSNY